MKDCSQNKCLVIIIVIIITIQDAVSKLGELADVNMAIDPVTDVKAAKSPRYLMNVYYLLVDCSIQHLHVSWCLVHCWTFSSAGHASPSFSSFRARPRPQSSQPPPSAI